MGQACWNWSEVTNASHIGFEPDASWIHYQHKLEGRNSVMFWPLNLLFYSWAEFPIHDLKNYKTLKNKGEKLMQFWPAGGQNTDKKADFQLYWSGHLQTTGAWMIYCNFFFLNLSSYSIQLQSVRSLRLQW